MEDDCLLLESIVKEIMKYNKFINIQFRKNFDNMRVFSSLLSLVVSVISFSSTGRRFHASGAATENACLPVFNLVGGMTRSPFEADRRFQSAR